MFLKVQATSNKTWVCGRPYNPESPSTQYLRSLVPNTIESMVFGTRTLENWVLGPLWEELDYFGSIFDAPVFWKPPLGLGSRGTPCCLATSQTTNQPTSRCSITQPSLRRGWLAPQVSCSGGFYLGSECSRSWAMGFGNFKGAGPHDKDPAALATAGRFFSIGRLPTDTGVS